METTQTMNAIRSHRRGGSETLVYEPVARPVPESGEVLVEVHAAAITPTEFTWDPTWTDEQGKSRLPIIPSHEISGVVAKVGTDAMNIAVGDEVYGLMTSIAMARRRSSRSPRSRSWRPSREAWTIFTRRRFHC